MPANSTMTDEEALEVLGLPKNSTPDEIKVRMRKLALQFHPDKNPDGEAKFKQYRDAYETLQEKKPGLSLPNLDKLIEEALRAHNIHPDQVLPELQRQTSEQLARGDALLNDASAHLAQMTVSQQASNRQLQTAAQQLEANMQQQQRLLALLMATRRLLTPSRQRQNPVKAASPVPSPTVTASSAAEAAMGSPTRAKGSTTKKSTKRALFTSPKKDVSSSPTTQQNAAAGTASGLRGIPRVSLDGALDESHMLAAGNGEVLPFSDQELRRNLFREEEITQAASSASPGKREGSPLKKLFGRSPEKAPQSTLNSPKLSTSRPQSPTASPTKDPKTTQAPSPPWFARLWPFK